MGLNVPTLDLLPFDTGSAGPRYLVAVLPAFRLERCGWRADDLVVLVAERQNATRVVALTPAAQAEGLRLGMVVAEARAIAPGVHVEPLDEEAEAVDQADLVRAFDVFGDRVTAWGDDAVLLEVSTTQAFFGGEPALLDRVRGVLADYGHAARLALTDHPRAAEALARAGCEGVVPAGQAADVLAPLPFTALRPSEALAEAVRALGLTTVGQWAALEPASVAGRWGDEGATLHRVARGGAGPAWARLPRPGPLERLRLPLDEDLVQVDAVMAVVGQGLARLQDQLRARDQVAAAVALRLDLASGGRARVHVRVAQPTRDPELLARLLAERLARLDLDAPVAGLWLHVPEVLPDGATQQDLLERRAPAGAWSELVARLTDVLGDAAVCQPVLAESWAPEEAWQPVSVLAPPPRPPPGCPDDPVERQEGAAWTAPRPRPTLLRSPPLPLRVRADDDGVPLAIRDRRGWWRIGRRRGPERLEGGWWRPNGGWARSYWVVTLPEGDGWIYEEKGQWFLHGWFD